MITDRGLELLMLRQYRTRSRFRPHPQEVVEYPDRPQIRLHGARSERAGRLRALMMLLLGEYIEQHPCAVPIIIMLSSPRCRFSVATIIIMFGFEFD